MADENGSEEKKPLDDFLEVTRNELDQVRTELREISLLVEQSQGEVDKLAQRNASVTAHLHQMQAHFDTVPREDLIALYTQAAVFVCPSIYEPFGLINLEAMACGTAVVASAVGGIPEVVVDGETGRLVSFQPRGEHDAEPKHPERFARDLATTVNQLIDSSDLLKTMGDRARRHVEAHFSWKAVAQKTMDYYASLINYQ